MSLMEFARALRKRWRVLIVTALFVTLLGAAYVALATPKYSAKAQLFVAASDQSDPASSYFGTLTSQQRVASYVDIIGSESVLSPVVRQLSLPYTWQHLGGEVSASNPTGTQLISVSVTDADASRAADIANAVADRASSYLATLDSVSGSAAPVKVTVFEHASPATSPSSPKVVLYVIAAVLVGLALGIGMALLRDSLDTSLKDIEDIKRRLKVAVLGAIPFDRATPKHPIVVHGSGGVGRAEAFRQLRTNLQFVQIDEQPRSIVVTSSVTDEGKTTTACNLAVVLAQVGVDVILVEGDLRRPRVAEYMGLESAVGLSSTLMGWSTWQDALQDWGTGDVRLRVLASGPLPPNPSEMLSGESMDRLLTELEDNCDVVIIDGPPLLPVADSAVLAASATGTVLVIRQGKTRYQQVARALQALTAVDGRLYGVVLNMARGRSVETEGYYYRGKGPVRGEFVRPGSTPEPAKRSRLGRKSKSAPPVVPSSPVGQETILPGGGVERERAGRS
jgi:capsular exopolysaccharide synthesis family protein